MKTYRLLTREEIARLEAQSCTAADWNGVQVHPDFNPQFVSHTRFSGKVKLGRMDGDFQLAGGISKHAGLCYVTLHNVTIGDDCCIENVKITLQIM